MTETWNEELLKTFRYLLIDLSSQLSEEECERIAFAELGLPVGERDKRNSQLRVLCKLEAHGKFSPLEPEGLRQILEHNNRYDLVNVVKDYMRSSIFKKARKEKAKDDRRQRKGGRGRSTDISNETKELIEIKQHADPRKMLKDSFTVTLTQASLLLKQVELLRGAILHASTKEEAEAAFHIVMKAEETADKLGRTLRKALSAAGLKSGNGSSSSEELGTSTLIEKKPQLISTEASQETEEQLQPQSSPPVARVHTPPCHPKRMPRPTPTVTGGSTAPHRQKPTPPPRARKRHPQPEVNDHPYDTVTYGPNEENNPSHDALLTGTQRGQQPELYDRSELEPSEDTDDNTGDYTGGTGDSGVGSGEDRLSKWIPHPPIQVSTKIPDPHHKTLAYSKDGSIHTYTQLLSQNRIESAVYSEPQT